MNKGTKYYLFLDPALEIGWSIFEVDYCLKKYKLYNAGSFKINNKIIIEQKILKRKNEVKQISKNEKVVEWNERFKILDKNLKKIDSNFIIFEDIIWEQHNSFFSTTKVVETATMVRGAIQYYFKNFQIKDVSSSIWKKYFELVNIGKLASCMFLEKKFPEIYFTYINNNHNIADAILIGIYYIEKKIFQYNKKNYSDLN